MNFLSGVEAGLKSALGQTLIAEAAKVLPAALQAAGFGSLQEVVDELQKAGLGQQVQSWLNGGAPQPITADELKTIFSNEQVQAIADHFGVNATSVLEVVAQFLPQAISAAGQHGLVSTSN